VLHVRENDGGGLPITQIRRQTPPSRACFEGLQPHQSFDPMQPARTVNSACGQSGTT
jgi:hypothetical protein